MKASKHAMVVYIVLMSFAMFLNLFQNRLCSLFDSIIKLLLDNIHAIVFKYIEVLIREWDGWSIPV